MRRRLALLAIAVSVAGADRLSKDAIHAASNVALPVELLGTWVRLVHGENRGGLFGLLQGSAPLLAALSVGVIALLLTLHERERAASVTLLTISIGALAGGAIGNLIDRVQYGYVLDFIDIGVGDLRFWTFNIADAAITAGILLILSDALLPPRLLSSLRVGGRR
jgi:signal peptidase II